MIKLRVRVLVLSTYVGLRPETWAGGCRLFELSSLLVFITLSLTFENRMTTVFSSNSFFIFFFHPFCEWFSYPTLHSLLFFLFLLPFLSSVCLPTSVSPPCAILYDHAKLSSFAFNLFGALGCIKRRFSLSSPVYLLILNIYICLLLFLPSLVDSHKTHLLSFPVRSHRFLPSVLSG